MAKGEFTGQLYFSDEEPHMIGQLTILGVEFAIEGTRISAVRANLTGRRRDGKPMQEDMFDERTADEGEAGSVVSGERKANDGVEKGSFHENKRV